MKIWIIPLLLFFYNCLQAQSNLGPRLTAMGNNGVSSSDVWAMEINPAGISKLHETIIALNFTKYLFSDEITSQGIVAQTSFKNNYLGLHAYRSGFTAYSEIKSGFAYAKSFGDRLSIGLNLNLHQIKIANYGANSTFSVDVGTHYKINKQFTAGLSVLNLSKQKYSKADISAEIPSTLNFGLSYFPSDKIELVAGASKTINQSINANIGIDYKLFNLLSLRAGFSIKPFKQYGGIGLNYKKFNFDITTSYNNNLGYIPQIALAYAF
jgi:hypothetical protein